MFRYAGSNVASFSLDLSGWNTTNVKNMYYMFDSAGYNATTWDINGLSSWDVSGVSNMESMFNHAGLHATTIDIDLHGWTISSAKSLSGMFNEFGLHATTFNPNLKDWDVNGVTDMSNMFFSAGSATSSFNLEPFSPPDFPGRDRSSRNVEDGCDVGLPQVFLVLENQQQLILFLHPRQIIGDRISGFSHGQRLLIRL